VNRAAEDGRERRLAHRKASAADGEITVARLVRRVARVALGQQGERRIGRAGGGCGRHLRKAAERHSGQHPSAAKHQGAAAKGLRFAFVAHGASPNLILKRKGPASPAGET